MTQFKIPELNALIQLSEKHSNVFQTHRLAEIPYKDQKFPLIALSSGSQDREAPALVLVGGIHGLERIGSRVILAFLESFAQRNKWNKSLKNQLKEIRIITIPIANPVGMLLQNRANGNGVDLMRNAPIESVHAMPFFGGQRISKYLPFYRGPEKKPMELELQSIEDFLRAEVFNSKSVVLLDVHSGFGGIDRIWFPYAHSRAPFPKLAETAALIRNFELAYPNHPYRIEPQAKSYCTHGDFWDYLFDEFEKVNSGKDKTLLAMTLEMGSWLWIKKNPIQMFSSLGVFDPIKPHRKKRVLRRHLTFLDFLRDSVHSHEAYSHLSADQRTEVLARAKRRWYRK